MYDYSDNIPVYLMNTDEKPNYTYKTKNKDKKVHLRELVTFQVLLQNLCDDLLQIPKGRKRKT